VNLFVQLHTSTAITASKYLLVRAADKSGSTYLEFDRRAQLEDKTWYCLRRFRVFGDKKYGFIASQQEYSFLDVGIRHSTYWVTMTRFPIEVPFSSPRPSDRIKDNHTHHISYRLYAPLYYRRSIGAILFFNSTQTTKRWASPVSTPGT
jgi:hypothetical protein